MGRATLPYLDRPERPKEDSPYDGMDLLRFTTAGSVDDGKSTLIGRLLHDTKSVFEDQLEAVERTSKQRGEGYVNLALLTDGLRAEREQNITIDVAYRYFATPRRKFIIGDTPGHVQYTRNMVTGASTAELAIILIDAQKGVSTQSKRHGFIASLLGIPHILVAVNKIDLLDYDQDAFERIRTEYTDFAAKLGVEDLTFIPISALRGDNVVDKSERTPWYQGPTLLHHLETVPVGMSRNLVDFRFPVQCVLRPDPSFRGYAGRIASGSVSPGEEVIVLPSGVKTTIASVETPNGPLDEARAGESVVLTTTDEVDISRGEMIVRSHNLPQINNRFEAILCWMSREPLDLSTGYVLQHTTRDTKAYVSKLHYRVDVDTLRRQDATTLGLNDIGRVEVTAAVPIFFDPYDRNRETGGFILVDPHTNVTVAAGMIRGSFARPRRSSIRTVKSVSRVRTWYGRSRIFPGRTARLGTVIGRRCSGSPDFRGAASPPWLAGWRRNCMISVCRRCCLMATRSAMASALTSDSAMRIDARTFVASERLPDSSSIQDRWYSAASFHLSKGTETS